MMSRAFAVALIVGLLMTAWAAPARAVSLSLVSGNSITFDTTTATYSGTVSGSGTIVGGVAHFGFDSVSLSAGVNVTLMGDKPMSLVSYGNLSIDTTFDASGQGQFGRLGGFNGGNIGTPPQIGFGPGGGGVTSSAGGCCWGGGGGGYGGAGGVDSFTGFVGQGGGTYGDPQISTLLGGSGGGGGGGCCGSVGNVGGSGGGAIGFFAEGTATFGSSTQVLVNGANGNPGNQNRTGGGGSGGSIRVGAAGGLNIAPGALFSSTGGTSPTNGSSDRVGGGGGGGRIALLASNLSNAGATNVAGGPSTNPMDAGNENGQVGTVFTGAGAGMLMPRNGLQLWLDASDASTITLAGGEVTQWRDKSGNNRNANAGGAQRPDYLASAINGHPALDFNRDQLTITGGVPIAAGADRTIFVVMDYSTALASNNSEILGTSTGTMIDVGTFSQVGRLRLRDSSNAGDLYSGAGTLPTGTHILAVEATAAGTLAISDGLELFDVSGKHSHFALNVNLGIGGAFFSGREYIGRLAEVLIYDRALSDQEINKVGEYLEQKYSLDTAFEVVTPEPATCVMGVMGALALLARRRRAA